MTVFVLMSLPTLILYGCAFAFLLEKDKEVEECQRFYKEGLSTSFQRILTDDAVNTWKPDIQVS